MRTPAGAEGGPCMLRKVVLIGVAGLAASYFSAVVYYTAQNLQQQAPDLRASAAMVISLVYWTAICARLVVRIAMSLLGSVVLA